MVSSEKILMGLLGPKMPNKSSLRHRLQNFPLSSTAEAVGCETSCVACEVAKLRSRQRLLPWDLDPMLSCMMVRDGNQRHRRDVDEILR
jgi:hypothetical protein